ncbi:MAG: winged helix-turn-helix domain-containing protein [Chloroflexi bacterium]|nr:winged helix-turn-helix domain-containing protein [Chloroflexota bacterium]
MPTQIPRERARRMLITAQGLATTRHDATPTDVVQTIERMGILQIDTIAVVNRSPYFVLWSRLGAYPTTWLDDALRDQHIFEAWVHEASFMPRSWWPAQRALIRAPDRPHTRRWALRTLESHPELTAHIRAELHDRRTVRPADFNQPRGGRGTWWDWSPAKRILEALFFLGDVSIAHREKFQRIYTSVHHYRPDWHDDDAPTYHEAQLLQIANAVRALGVAHERWISDYYRMGGKYSSEYKSKRLLFAELVDRGTLIPVEINELPGAAYVHVDHLALLHGDLPVRHTTLLSPFDPIVWHRQRAEELFDFQYRIECYTPAPKRQYGYFTLPILYHDRLVGRADCKAHRGKGFFEIISLHFEPGVAPDPQMHAEILATIRACAAWHATPEVVVRMISDETHTFAYRDVVARRS